MIISNQTQPERTKADDIADAKASIDSSINILFQSMKDVYVSNYNRVWNNPAYTPAEILAAYGADGGELFRLSTLLATIIETANPGTLPQNTLAAGSPYTIGSDGVITLATVAP